MLLLMMCTSEDEEDSESEVPTSFSEEIGSRSCTSEDEEESEIEVPTSLDLEDCTVDKERRERLAVARAQRQTECG